MNSFKIPQPPLVKELLSRKIREQMPQMKNTSFKVRIGPRLPRQTTKLPTL